MKNKIFFLSLIGFFISIAASYYLNTIFKQALIEAEQRKLLATAHASASHVESHFNSLQNTVTTIGSSDIVLTALKDFEKVFYKIEKETQLSSKHKASLLDYYSNHFINKLDNNQTDSIEKYLPETLSGLIAQYSYISDNHYKVGDKEKLLFAPNNKISYNEIHKKFHPILQREQKNYEFYDIFLIDSKGTIVYSVEKELDFATNLTKGPYSTSNLAKVYHKAMDLQQPQVVFEDFAPYEPSNNKSAAFISFPIHENNKVIGVFAVQIPIVKINEIMSFNNKRKESGLGESGEAYLVGEDKLMRSDSRFIQDIQIPQVQKMQTTVGIVKVDSHSVNQALKGESGSELIKDYRGVNVFSAYLPITVFNNKWVVLAEIDEEEIINLLKRNSILVFLLTTGIIGIIILGFIFIIYRYFIKPLEKHNITLDKQVLVSQSLLNEYKKAVDSSSIVSKTDLNGRITYANDEFSNISGYEFSELVGKSHSLIRHPDTPSSLFKELWQTIKSKKIWKGIIKNKTKDGRDYYVNSTIVPMLDENSNIKEYMSIRSDVTDLINKEKLILKHTTDLQTGLPNRIKFIESIELNNNDIKLAIVNINGIQSINDFYGGQYGEKLIIEVANSLQELVEIENIKLFKIANDAFALLYQGQLSLKDFIEICESIKKHFDHNSFQIDNDNFDVTMTMGIAKDRKNIYVNAERALHNAYETNQDIVCYDTSADIKNNFEKNRKWVTKIKEAIRNDKIIVFAQPIISLCNTYEKKYECLIRMIDDDGTIISPYYFLEIAKSSRLYTTLTKIVIEKSFTHFSTINAAFSINLTIDDIMNEELLKYLKQAIKKYNVAHKLVLEIVESEGIENFNEVTGFIAEMKSYGCKISIDDFGTGYSNFEYLMQIDADYIKIDGSLIKNIDKDKSAQLVVELIVDFAKKLNRKTIAEYVHNEDVLKKVKEMKIDYSQGYFTGEPAILNDITKLES